MTTIGFTGTRHGMSVRQKHRLCRELTPLLTQDSRARFLEGDCVGADEEAAALAKFIDARTCVIALPGPGMTMRAYAPADEVRPIKTHFARNRDIVKECAVLLACPGEMTEQARGGTWYTINYAKKVGKPVRILWPDGSMTYHSAETLEKTP